MPELLFTNEENPGEAVSAVKALAVATAEGQRIYQVTQENVNTVLPALNISADVKDEISASVAVGKVATVSQNNITISDWTGVGYIIADPETGAGAYRISGGANGALLLGVGILMIGVLAFILALISPFTITSAFLLAAPFILGTALIFISFITMSILELGWNDLDWNLLKRDLGAVLFFLILPVTAFSESRKAIIAIIGRSAIVFDAFLGIILTHWDLLFGEN